MISPEQLYRTHRLIALDEVAALPGNPNQGHEESLSASLDEFGWFDGIVVCDGVVLAGNHRVEAARARGEKHLPGYDLSGLGIADHRRLAMAIAHNATTRAGEDDRDLLRAALAEIGEVEPVLVDVLDTALGLLPKYQAGGSGRSMLDDFVVPPFSVLDTRQGYWQDRKREWLSYGMASELGRDEGLISGGYAKLSIMSGINEGTSVFDPVLCEVVYRWFTPGPGARILDPFAGGVVRGAVASLLGYEYVGIELRAEQVEANEAQKEVWADAPGPEPKWIVGDARDVAELVDDDFDLVFSCPPYADLEVYSDDPADLSTLPPEQFLDVHGDIIRDAVSRLRPNRFIVWVVSEVRHSGKKGGPYIGFVPATVKAMEAAGAQFYNEAILINAVGTLPVRAGRTMDTARKLGRGHQNVVVGASGSDLSEFAPPAMPLPDAGEYVDLGFAEDRHLPEGHSKMLASYSGDLGAVGEVFPPIRVDG